MKISNFPLDSIIEIIFRKTFLTNTHTIICVFPSFRMNTYFIIIFFFIKLNERENLACTIYLQSLRFLMGFPPLRVDNYWRHGFFIILYFIGAFECCFLLVWTNNNWIDTARIIFFTFKESRKLRAEKNLPIRRQYGILWMKLPEKERIRQFVIRRHTELFNNNTGQAFEVFLHSFWV